jgi:hypothetical protein
MHCVQREGFAARDKLTGTFVLGTHRKSCIFPHFPNEFIPDSEGKTRKLPPPDEDRSLKAISNDFRRVLSADGTLDGDEDCFDHLRDEFRSIEGEAASSL